MSMSTPVRRRFLAPLLVLSALGLYLLLPSLPVDVSLWSPIGSPSAQAARTREIHGLLHFVVNNPDKILVPLDDSAAPADDEPFDPETPIELRVYAEDGAQVDPVRSARDWAARADKLDRETPLVVFSKSQCPYSRRAKELLASYDLHPPPRIIEVDHRGDGDLIKAILARLTGRATFPNVVLRGASIGGADTVQDLHDRGKLAPMLRRAGIRVRADVGARR